MKQLCKLLFLLINIYNVWSQKDQGSVLTEEDIKAYEYGSYMVKTTDMLSLYEGVKGTPYLFDNWKIGEVYFKDNTLVRDILVRYNIYTDDIEYKNSTSGESIILKRDKIREFRIFDDKINLSLQFSEFNFKPGENEKFLFAQVLYDGSTKFLLRRAKEFRKANYQGAYSSGIKYDEFYDNNKYYMLKKDGSLLKIKLTEKHILKTLSDKDSEIKKYINEKHPDLSADSNIIELLRYYDKLE